MQLQNSGTVIEWLCHMCAAKAGLLCLLGAALMVDALCRLLNRIVSRIIRSLKQSKHVVVMCANPNLTLQALASEVIMITRDHKSHMTACDIAAGLRLASPMQWQRRRPSPKSSA